jgi:uncharacterized membrane protein
MSDSDKSDLKSDIEAANKMAMTKKPLAQRSLDEWLNSLPHNLSNAIVLFLEMGILLFLLGIGAKVVGVNIGQPLFYIGLGISLMILSVILIVVGACKSKARAAEVSKAKERLTSERLDSIDKKLDELVRSSRRSYQSISLSLMVAGVTLLATGDNKTKKFLGAAFALMGLMLVVIPGLISSLTFPFRYIKKIIKSRKKGKS